VGHIEAQLSITLKPAIMPMMKMKLQHQETFN